MATYKPSTNTDPTKAAYGESSAGVKALQASLNQQNAGKPGYTQLKEDGLYGPLTQAAAGYKAPTPTATTTTPVDTNRYARTANANDATISNLRGKLDSAVGDEPSLSDITSKKRAEAEGLIGSITAEFNRIIDEQNGVNSGLNDRVRALNTSAGLGGSDFGTANAVNQEKKNQKAIDLINAEKAAKIQAVLSGIDSRASEEYRQQRQEYVKGLGDQLDRVTQAREEDKQRAKDSITALARQGVALDKLKETDPKSYDVLLQEYGGSPMDLEGEWNDSLPDDQKVKYETKIIQGPGGKAQVFRYGLNPRTGTVEQKEYDLGVDFNTLNGVKPISVGGRLFALTKDAQGNEIAKPLSGFSSGSSSSGKTVKSGKVTFTGSQLSEVSKELEKSKTLYNGDGKYVNPQVYEQAYQAWTEVGGLGKDFLTQFPPAKYVNPENDKLPEYLRSAKKTSTIAPKAKDGTSIEDL